MVGGIGLLTCKLQFDAIGTRMYLWAVASNPLLETRSRCPFSGTYLDLLFLLLEDLVRATIVGPVA